MSQIHLILSFVELALLAVFGVCVFYEYNKNWNFWTRASIAVLILIINIVQMVLEIRLEQNFVLSVMMIFIWGINLWIYYLLLKKRNFKWK